MTSLPALCLACTLTVAATFHAFPAAANDSDHTCVVPGHWTAPDDGRRLDHANLIRELAGKPVVLLGETHDNAEHHRWQLDVFAALHAVNPNMVIGFESFPRRVQPVLDQWTQGLIDERTFLDKVGWREVWGYPAEQYMPLFHFARRHRLPMIALNVDIALIRKVRQEGWAQIAEADRLGIGDPAAALPEYERRLRDFFLTHERMRRSGGHGKPQETEAAQDPTPETLTEDQEARFKTFVEAQLLWDRAMAEALAKVRTAGGEPLVIGIMGSGHLTGRVGVPYQLTDLKIPDSAVLLPWTDHRDCADLAETRATAVFGLDALPEPPERPRMRLGVLIESGSDGVKLLDVLTDSTADRTGLKKGDVLVAAAGRQVRTVRQLKDVIAGMSPGVWLPLEVKRGKETLSLVAKFPPHP